MCTALNCSNINITSQHNMEAAPCRDYPHATSSLLLHLTNPALVRLHEIKPV